jgi:hypothetical protein
VEVYIVRVYRRGNGDPARIAGLVEQPGVVGKDPFLSMEKFWTILSRKTTNKDAKSAGSAPDCHSASDSPEESGRGRN